MRQPEALQPTWTNREAHLDPMREYCTTMAAENAIYPWPTCETTASELGVGRTRPDAEGMIPMRQGRYSRLHAKALRLREKARKSVLYLRPINCAYREANLDWSKGLGPYPLDLERFLETGHFALRDDAGLPVYDDGSSITHNYTGLCGWALAHWARYQRTRDEKDLEPVLLASNYILRTADRRAMGMFLRSEVPGRGHVGTISAMAQGEAISVLLRSFEATGKGAFLEGALGCLGPFFHSVDEGGVVSDDFGVPWFEEYTTRPYGHVLNGMIVAVWGLCDLAAIAPKSGANRLAAQGLKSLELVCARFDLGWWSAYSVGENAVRVASIQYHGVHIAQLRALERQTGSRAYADLATRFENYSRSPANRIRSALKMFGRNAEGSGLPVLQG
jgi:hypothetical protein